MVSSGSCGGGGFEVDAILFGWQVALVARDVEDVGVFVAYVGAHAEGWTVRHHSMVANGAATPMLSGAAVDWLLLWFVQEAKYASVRRRLSCAHMAVVWVLPEANALR